MACDGVVDRLCRLRLEALQGSETGPKRLDPDGDVQLANVAKQQRLSSQLEVNTILKTARLDHPPTVNLDNATFFHVGVDLSAEFKEKAFRLANVSVRFNNAWEIVLYKTADGLECVIFFVQKTTSRIMQIGFFELEENGLSIESESFRTLHSASMLRNIENADETLTVLMVKLKDSKASSGGRKEAQKAKLVDDLAQLEAEYKQKKDELDAEYKQKKDELNAESSIKHAEMAAEPARLKAQIEDLKTIKLENKYSNIVRRGPAKSNVKKAPKGAENQPLPGDANPGPVAELDSSSDEDEDYKPNVLTLP